MDKIKQWVVLTVVTCLAVMAAGWFLVISPKRGEAAELRTQAADQVAANSALETELQVLKAQAAELPAEQAKLAAVAAKIPDNPALPGLVRSLIEAADKAGVDLVSVAPAEPVLVAPPAPAAPTAPAAGDGAAQTTPEAPAAEAAAGPAAAAPGPAGQLAEIPLAIDVAGDYADVQAFLAAVEEMGRAVLVEGLTMAPGASPTADDAEQAKVELGKSLTATINGYVFMAANRPAPTTATVPADAAE